jgi:hypothetical protein
MGYLGSWQRGGSTLAIVAAGALLIAVSAATLSRGSEVAGVSSDAEGLERPALVWRLPLFWIGLAVISLACWANMSFSDLTPGFLSVAAPAG